ncbi:MAG: MoxR family ATPase, partial [Planctomycetota bacterium]
HRGAMTGLEGFELDPLFSRDDLIAARRAIAEIRLSEEVIVYIVDVVRATRDHASLMCGASPRAANMLATASRAWAALHGRDFVIPDDVKDIAVAALAHRVVLSPSAEIEGTTSADIIRSLLDQVAAPR